VERAEPVRSLKPFPAAVVATLNAFPRSIFGLPVLRSWHHIADNYREVATSLGEPSVWILLANDNADTERNIVQRL
jgi:hypothetical protein